METKRDTEGTQWVMEKKDKKCSCGRENGEWHTSWSHIYGDHKDISVTTVWKAPKRGKL